MLEFTDKVVGSYAIMVFMTEQDIENVIVAALEGGIGYWAVLDNTGPEWKSKPKGEPTSTWATKLLLEGKTIKFSDAETGEDGGDEWTLTLDKLINGINLNHQRRPDHSDKDCWDAFDADCIVQYALFGQVVFG